MTQFVLFDPETSIAEINLGTQGLDANQLKQFLQEWDDLYKQKVPFVLYVDTEPMKTPDMTFLSSLLDFLKSHRDESAVYLKGTGIRVADTLSRWAINFILKFYQPVAEVFTCETVEECKNWCTKKTLEFRLPPWAACFDLLYTDDFFIKNNYVIDEAIRIYDFKNEHQISISDAIESYGEAFVKATPNENQNDLLQILVLVNLVECYKSINLKPENDKEQQKNKEFYVCFSVMQNKNDLLTLEFVDTIQKATSPVVDRLFLA